MKAESDDLFPILFSFLQGGVLGKPFQKMRRRLTVTGSSETIDGGVQKDHAEEETAKAQTKKKVRLCDARIDVLECGLRSINSKRCCLLAAYPFGFLPTVCSCKLLFVAR